MDERETTEATTMRLDVKSPDGTPLAVWVDGEGPALVLVHGCPSEHTTFDPLIQELREDVTTYAMDCRGSGASGDTAPYAIERRVRRCRRRSGRVAARTGGLVALRGHSYGCTRPSVAPRRRTGTHRSRSLVGRVDP